MGGCLALLICLLCSLSLSLSLCQQSSQSDMRSLCGRSDCPPLRTILYHRKCIGQRHASVRRNAIKPGVLGRPLEHLQERSGGYPSAEPQQMERMLDAGTSRLNIWRRGGTIQIGAHELYVDDALQARMMWRLL